MAKDIHKNPKFSINLLPEEFSVKQKEQQKFNTVQTFSVVGVLVLVFLASVVVVLRLLQSQKIDKLQSDTQLIESKVSDFKGKEASLFVLKNRLTNVSQILKQPSKQVDNYYLVAKIIPSGVLISSISVDRFGSVSLALLCPNQKLLEQLLAGLTSPTAFKTFNQIEVESLTRGKDGFYRANLKVVPKS
jgi:hypothetical protein